MLNLEKGTTERAKEPTRSPLQVILGQDAKAEKRRTIRITKKTKAWFYGGRQDQYDLEQARAHDAQHKERVVAQPHPDSE